MQQEVKPGRQKASNIIRLAVLAAGGDNAVATEFGISRWSVRDWIRRSRVPSEKIRRLCDMGGVFTPDQVLAQIEAAMADREAA